jgi:hypothetical protein
MAGKGFAPVDVCQVVGGVKRIRPCPLVLYAVAKVIQVSGVVEAVPLYQEVVIVPVTFVVCDDITVRRVQPDPDGIVVAGIIPDGVVRRIYDVYAFTATGAVIVLIEIVMRRVHDPDVVNGATDYVVLDD